MNDTPDNLTSSAAPPDGSTESADNSAVPGPHWGTGGEPLPGNPLLAPDPATDPAAPQQAEPESTEHPPEGVTVTPQPQEEPAVSPFVASSPASPEPETNTSTPAGTATSATAPGASGGDGTPTAAPDADTPPPAEVVPRLHPGVHVHINAIEQLALFWGGDTGNTIRNHLGRLRDLLSRL